MGDRWTVVDNSQKPKEKRYYFLKISKQFWRDKAIKKLRRLPGGDTYAIIVQEICLEALESDNRLYYDGIEDTFAQELALTLDEDPTAVQVAVDFLLSIGWMTKEEEDAYYVPKSEELSGSITSRGMRKQRQKEREKLLADSRDAEQSSDIVPSEFLQVPTYRDRTRDRNRTRTRDRGISLREEGKSLDLYALCPEAFSEDWEPADPSLEDVRSYAITNGFTDITAEDFFGTFSPSEGERRITNWKALYLRLELLSRQGWERE